MSGIASGSFSVRGIEITPEKDQFNNSGVRIEGTSDQSYTIISFYQRYNSNEPFEDNIFFSVSPLDFYYCKLQYWIGREGYNHTPNQPNYVYYFEEECFFDQNWNSGIFWHENKIVFASGWDQYISTNTDNGSSNLNLYPPLYLADVQDPNQSRPVYNTSGNIVFRKPIQASEDNETHVRGIAYLL